MVHCRLERLQVLADAALHRSYFVRSSSSRALVRCSRSSLVIDTMRGILYSLVAPWVARRAAFGFAGMPGHCFIADQSQNAKVRMRKTKPA